MTLLFLLLSALKQLDRSAFLLMLVVMATVGSDVGVSERFTLRVKKEEYLRKRSSHCIREGWVPWEVEGRDSTMCITFIN